MKISRSVLSEVATSQANGNRNRSPTNTTIRYVAARPTERRAPARVEVARPARACGCSMVAIGVNLPVSSPRLDLIVGPARRAAQDDQRDDQDQGQEHPRHGRGVAHTQVPEGLVVQV